MKLKNLMVGVLSLGLLQSAVAAPVGDPRALEEFEVMTEKVRNFHEAIESGDLILPFKVQQYDTNAKEVQIHSELSDYKLAMTDAYYGYQMFILVDKSVSPRPGKHRDPEIRTPQTAYIFEREGDQVRLIRALPISTGRETSPREADTREGFLRVQSAQAQYTSRKFGVAMPFSLWVESEYGIALHETLQSKCNDMIGMRASAGCVRLCPGDAESLFRMVTDAKYPRSSPIVLLDKRSGLPIARGQDRVIRPSLDEEGKLINSPKVIRGYPVFVRIIDGNKPEKIQEIENLIQNPTEAFRNYFKPFSQKVLDDLTT